MPRRGKIAAVLALAGVACFWCAIVIAAALEPGYSHRRDYVSTLASRGAEHGELAVLAVVAAGAAMVSASFLVREVSRLAAVAVALAGAGFVVAAFIRLECAEGAAGCGLGGRFEISGATEVGHWTATTVSTILLVGGMALAGVALLRRRHGFEGAATVAAAALTAAAFLATGGSHPGVPQRVGIVLGTGWLATVAIAALVRERWNLSRQIDDY